MKTFKELYIQRETPKEFKGKKEITRLESKLQIWNHFFDNFEHEIDKIESNQDKVKFVEKIISEAKDYNEWLKNLSCITHTEKADFIYRIIELLEQVKTSIMFTSPYSVLEWATIFYYANGTKLLPDQKTLKNRQKQFIEKHHISTTPGNFKNKYYYARRRINDKKDYPIDKLNSIRPFLLENYQQAVTFLDNDITFLESEKPEY